MTDIPDDVVERALAAFEHEQMRGPYESKIDCLRAAGRVFVEWERERAAQTARDCAIYDENDKLLNSDIRATCAAAIRARTSTPESAD